jgi:hypothetical protein
MPLGSNPLVIWNFILEPGHFELPKSGTSERLRLFAKLIGLFLFFVKDGANHIRPGIAFTVCLRFFLFFPFCFTLPTWFSSLLWKILSRLKILVLLTVVLTVTTRTEQKVFPPQPFHPVPIQNAGWHHERHAYNGWIRGA